MFLTLLFLISQIILGFLIFNFFDPEKKFSRLEKTVGSIFLGSLFSSFSILLFALILKSLSKAILLFFFTIFLMLLVKFFSFKNNFENFFKKIKKISFSPFQLSLKIKKICCSKNIWSIYLTAILFFYFLFICSILFEENGSLKSVLIGWGDNALHIGLIKRLSTANPFNLEHPFLANHNLTYPFLINFISGLFYKLGNNFIFSYRAPLFIFGITGIFLIFSFASYILKSKSWAILALIFILFGSGFGFLILFNDIKEIYQENGLIGVYRLIKNPPHEYTHLDNRTGGKSPQKETKDNIVWIVPIISFLGHQRSFSLGFTLFSFILLGIYHYGKSKYFWRFGLVAGLLPFSHTHTFLGLFFLLAVLFWFFLFNWKSWIKFAIITGVLALPQIHFFKKSSNIFQNSLFRPWFGWMSCEHLNSWFFCYPREGTDSNYFFFWLKNFGVVFGVWFFIILILLLILLLGVFKKNFSFFLIKRLKEHFDQKYLISSFILFILPNLFLFQPWAFDNNKILFYWWILAIIFALCPFLKILWRKRILGKILVVFLVFLGILAGTFDFFSKFFWTKKESFSYSSQTKENIKIGQWIKRHTLPNALFLTASTADSLPLFLAGRPIYLGFEGWLWSQGVNYQENKRKIEEILAGNLEKACQEKIDFIFFDRNLKISYPKINKKILFEKTETVFFQRTPFEEKRILKILCQNS